MHTYAPRGQTPVLVVPLTHDHLSVIGALTAQGRLLTGVLERAYQGGDVVGFLAHLLRQIRGRLLIIWDGAPIHHSREVQAFLAAGGARRIHLEVLPGYAPDLNPQEGIWHHLKQVELGNVCCHDVHELRAELRRALARLRHKPVIIRGCITQCGY
jgi:transposase